MYEANKKKYTVKDYQALPEGSLYQLINGDMVMTPAPSPAHQKIILNLSYQLEKFLRQNKPGEVYISPIDVYFSEIDIYQPDIIFISNENLKLVGDKMIEGAPDLVIEVLSESNAYYDLRVKKSIYESSGVKEYWIVDPMAKNIEVYENDGGSFRIFSKSEISGFVISKIFSGLEVTAESIF